jgi:hypothetical protein
VGCSVARTEEGDDERPKAPSQLDSALKLVKLLAILLSGCWALFQFLSFQSQSNRILLKQQEIAKQQSDVNLQIATATQQATIAQATIAAQQANFTLKTQQAEKELREQELKYTVEEKRLDAQSKQLEVISRTTYKAAKQTRWEARELRDGLLQVVYHPGITNASQEAFEVSSIEVSVYAGYINPVINETANPSQLEDAEARTDSKPIVIDPPHHGEKIGRDGAITWRRIAARTSVYWEAASDIRYSVRRPYEVDSFGTGVWKSGEEVQFEPEVLIDPKGIDFIAFSVRMIFNRNRKDEDNWWFSDWRPVTALLGHDHTEKAPTLAQTPSK